MAPSGTTCGQTTSPGANIIRPLIGIPFEVVNFCMTAVVAVVKDVDGIVWAVPAVADAVGVVRLLKL